MSDKPTEEQIKELWQRCGLYKSGYWWFDPNGKHLISTVNAPYININFLFKYAVPIAVVKLESRFGAEVNLIRGLELLFHRWLDNIREGMEINDALFWAIWEVFNDRETIG
jgi:hypothetical protein